MISRKQKVFLARAVWGLISALLLLKASGQDLPVPPPILNRDVVPMLHLSRMAASVTYSIGQPTGEEQYYLELLNRARANPTAEGTRLASTTDPDVLNSYKYYSVNLTMMQSEFKAMSVQPPLAMNASLMQAARAHASDMFNKQFQGHTGSNGSTMSARITSAGYAWKTIGENVYSYADSVWHGHAGFQVDWGSGTGGMQIARGHRANIHSAKFREVGVGVVSGTNGSVGPQLVTQDFGAGMASQAFITGVAYYDVDGDGFYDPGEGIGGLTVQAQGASRTAVTADSGGYAIPVATTNANRLTTFSGLSLSFSANAVITSGKNVKVDFKPAYKPPVVTGSTAPRVGLASTYKFSTLGGATAYDWRLCRETPVAFDGGENLLRGTTNSAGGYALISKTVKFSGSAAYRFAQPKLNRDETFTYTAEFLPGRAASISFRSRLGWASKTQFAKIQVSSNGGATWSDVYSQAGSGSAGETGFQMRTISLASYAGTPIRLRLNYTMTTGTTAYYQTDDRTGWFVDDVLFYDVGELSAPVIKSASLGGSFVFTPTTAGIYHLAVRPIISARAWAFGQSFKAVASKK